MNNQPIDPIIYKASLLRNKDMPELFKFEISYSNSDGITELCGVYLVYSHKKAQSILPKPNPPTTIPIC